MPCTSLELTGLVYIELVIGAFRKSPYLSMVFGAEPSVCSAVAGLALILALRFAAMLLKESFKFSTKRTGGVVGFSVMPAAKWNFRGKLVLY